MPGKHYQIVICAQRQNGAMFSSPMNRKRIPSGTKLPVYYSEQDLADIREHTFADTNFGNYAITKGKRWRVELSLDEIETSRAISQPKQTILAISSWRRRLDSLFRRLPKTARYVSR
jgi:hypothetical protein